MPEYDVKVQIRVPRSRNPQTGAVKYGSDGSIARTVTVNASSPEEARKLATKSDTITKARTAAAKGLDYDMPKPRAKILDVKPSGSRGGGGGSIGGAMDSALKGTMQRSGRLPKRMNKGGYVNCGASNPATQKRSK